jgi:dTDP-4-dehydrorhamnose reductase
MLRLAETRDEIGVVDDQRGCPTSAIDLADALIAAARKRLEAPGDSALAGIFHMAGAGAASWADLAEEIFAASARLGGPIARVRRIATADYPTPARRPADSRLDQTKLADAYGLTLPPWRGSVANCVARLLEERKRS